MAGLMARKMAGMGRNGDTEVAHLTPGEVVVPGSVLQQPGTRGLLRRSFDRAGRDFGRYEVGGMDDSRNPRTGMREYFDPGDMEGAQDPGFDAGDYGGMDAGSFGAMEGDYSGVEGYSGPGISDFGADMEDSPAETPFDFGQYAKAQAWGDYNKGYDVAKAMPFGLGLFARAINMGVQHGVLPEPMTRAELAMDRADWTARGPMVGGVGADRGMPDSGVPKNGLAPSAPRGVYTPPAPTAPLYQKYMDSVVA